MPPEGPTLDNQGAIEEDIYCRRCGYNLRTLRLDGPCPECGLAVRDSIFGHLLRFSDPVWVRRLRRGIVLILAGIFSTFGLTVINVVALVLLECSRISMSWAEPWTFGVMSWATLLALAGLWMTTSPEPEESRQEDPPASRRWARTLPLCLLGLAGGGLLAGWAVRTDAIDQLLRRLDLPPRLLWMWMRCALVVWFLAMSAVLTAWVCVVLAYARYLAMRIPDARLASQTRRIFWGWVLLWMVPVVTYLLVTSSARLMALLSRLPLAQLLLAVSSVLIGLGTILLIIWSAWLCARFHTRLRMAGRLPTTQASAEDAAGR